MASSRQVDCLYEYVQFLYPYLYFCTRTAIRVTLLYRYILVYTTGSTTGSTSTVRRTVYTVLVQYKYLPIEVDYWVLSTCTASPSTYIQVLVRRTSAAIYVPVLSTYSVHIPVHIRSTHIRTCHVYIPVLVLHEYCTSTVHVRTTTFYNVLYKYSIYGTVCIYRKVTG